MKLINNEVVSVGLFHMRNYETHMNVIWNLGPKICKTNLSLFLLDQIYTLHEVELLISCLLHHRLDFNTEDGGSAFL
jgi:hypothetical protein